MTFAGLRPLTVVGPAASSLVGPIGLVSTFGTRPRDLADAVERGCNYLLLGPRRQPLFVKSLRELTRSRREALVLGLDACARSPLQLRLRLELELRRIGTDHFDYLLLGAREWEWSERFFEVAARLRDKGKVRFVAAQAPAGAEGADLLARVDRSLVDVVHARFSALQPDLPAGLADANAPALVIRAATGHGLLLRPHWELPRPPTFADCYRFVLSQGGPRVCLAGVPDMSELRDVLLALERGPMTGEELAWMRRVGEIMKQAGRATPARAA